MPATFLTASPEFTDILKPTHAIPYNYHNNANNNLLYTINPNYTKALFNLATVKYELNLNACNEYKKACELGHSRACYFYRQDCR